jgi:hypothetical protein
MVKGSPMVAVAKFIRSRHAEAAAWLPQRCQHYLHERLLASNWYPEADFRDLIRVVAKLLPGSGDEALHNVGRASFNAYVRDNMYTALHSADSLVDMPRRLEALWRTHHDTGRLRMLLLSETTATINLAGFGLPSHELCTALTGYWEAMMIANFERAHVDHVTCATRGAEECVWQVVL